MHLDIVPVSRLTEHGHLNITAKLEFLSKNRTGNTYVHTLRIDKFYRFISSSFDWKQKKSSTLRNHSQKYLIKVYIFLWIV